MYNCYKTPFMFMTFLWTVPIIYLVNIKIHFHFQCHATYLLCKVCYNWWHIFIVSNLIGSHIFLWLEPQNSIPHQQTLVQGLGKKIILVYTICTTNHMSSSHHMTPLVINSLVADTHNVQHMPLNSIIILRYYLHYQFPHSWGYLANINYKWPLN